MIHNVQDFKIGQMIEVFVGGQYVDLQIEALAATHIAVRVWQKFESSTVLFIERSDWETLIRVK